ncbi:hypothetical protein QL285_064432 [Trifolium repens]|nr:hypothetical protein QL285_064432 [Trifolium repens]
MLQRQSLMRRRHIRLLWGLEYASFASHLNRVGIGICICDELGQFVLSKTEWINRRCGVDVGGPRGDTTLWNSSSDVAAACTAATAKGLRYA